MTPDGSAKTIASSSPGWVRSRQISPLGRRRARHVSLKLLTRLGAVIEDRRPLPLSVLERAGDFTPQAVNYIALLAREGEAPSASTIGPMKISKLTEKQIAYALRQIEGGTAVGESCRRLAISEQAFYRWKAKATSQYQ